MDDEQKRHYSINIEDNVLMRNYIVCAYLWALQRLGQQSVCNLD